MCHPSDLMLEESDDKLINTLWDTLRFHCFYKLQVWRHHQFYLW